METIEIVTILHRQRFSLSNEKILQAQIEQVLSSHGLKFSREFRIDSRSVIDFLCESIGLEVKIKGRAFDILRQCQRYAQSDKIKELILVTNRSTGFPTEINGKPCYVVTLGNSWL